MGSARQDAEHALAHPTSPLGRNGVHLELCRAYLGALETLDEANHLGASFVAKHATVCEERARLRADVKRLQALVEATEAYWSHIGAGRALAEVRQFCTDNPTVPCSAALRFMAIRSGE